MNIYRLEEELDLTVSPNIDLWRDLSVGNVISKDGLFYRVNSIYESGEYVVFSLQVTAYPYYGVEITKVSTDEIEDGGYEYVADFIDEIAPLEYEGGKLDESLLKPVNQNYNPRVDYIYSFDSVSWLFIETEYLFLWSREEGEWQLRVGENGRASLDEIYDLNYLHNDVIEKAEELRNLGDPAYWNRDLTSAVYSVSLVSGEVYFLYNGREWTVSSNQNNWEDVSLIASGDSRYMRLLNEVDRNFIGGLASKDFDSGMNILTQRNVYGRLDYLYED